MRITKEVCCNPRRMKLRVCAGALPPPPDVWTPVPEFREGVGYWSPCELRRRCRETSQYAPFFRAIRSIKTDGCGNGRGIKAYLSTRLNSRDADAVMGVCARQFPRHFRVPGGMCTSRSVERRILAMIG
jgi:hypothetical protein